MERTNLNDESPEKFFGAGSSAWLERSTDKLIQTSKGREFESHSAHSFIQAIERSKIV